MIIHNLHIIINMKKKRTTCRTDLLSRQQCVYVAGQAHIQCIYTYIYMLYIRVATGFFRKRACFESNCVKAMHTRIRINRRNEVTRHE